MDTATEREFESLARQAWPREAVAFVVVCRGRYRLVPIANVAERPEESAVTTAADWTRAEALGEVVALLHSHPDAEAAPSPLDQSAAEASGLAWIICGFPQGRDGPAEWARLPARAALPLIGRRFVHGVTDCWSCVRDAFHERRGILLPDFHRVDNWWKDGRNLAVEYYPQAGLGCIGRGPAAVARLEVDDFLLFHIDSNVPNHWALYLGENWILHHLGGRLSSRDPLAGWLIERLTHVLRYGASDHA